MNYIEGTFAFICSIADPNSIVPMIRFDVILPVIVAASIFGLLSVDR